MLIEEIFDFLVVTTATWYYEKLKSLFVTVRKNHNINIKYRTYVVCMIKVYGVFLLPF